MVLWLTLVDQSQERIAHPYIEVALPRHDVRLERQPFVVLVYALVLVAYAVGPHPPGRDVQPALVIGRKRSTPIPQCTGTGCVTQLRCIVPAHYHVQLHSVDQSQEGRGCACIPTSR